jgi:hypothetical protein
MNRKRNTKNVASKDSKLNYVVDTLDINDEKFESKLIEMIKESGVVVIKNVINPDKCDEYTERTVSGLEQISDFKKDDLKSWIPRNLPPQIRPGMFHEIICNTPCMNEIRFNPNIIKIFKTYYSHFKQTEYKDTDMIVSNDGLNIKPGTIPPFDTIDHDWAHLDQTQEPENPYKCIQGQMVLSNTSASFRASPRSHLLFEEFLTQTGNPHGKGNFLKFNPEQYLLMRKKLENIGGAWQIKIPATKGDFIIWTSATVHSATLQDGPEYPLDTDKWNGWRHVVFICYRPRDEYTHKELKAKYEGFLTNRVTNHWGTMIFPKGFAMRNKKNNFTEKICGFSENPETVYDIQGFAPNLTIDQSKMMGLID